jgi:hypothetical protein
MVKKKRRGGRPGTKSGRYYSTQTRAGIVTSWNGRMINYSLLTMEEYKPFKLNSAYSLLESHPPRVFKYESVVPSSSYLSRFQAP